MDFHTLVVFHFLLAALAARKEVIRNKVRAVGKMVRYFATLRFVRMTFGEIILLFSFVHREQSEDILTLKGLTPGGTLPLGTLEGGKTTIEQGKRSIAGRRKSSLDFALAKQLISNKKRISFEEAKRLDKSNESMPPWQQLHPSSSGITSASSASSSSSNSASTSSRIVGSGGAVSSVSSPVNTLADASSSVTNNLLMDSTNTNCIGNGNEKTSGRTGNDSSKNPYRMK